MNNKFNKTEDLSYKNKKYQGPKLPDLVGYISESASETNPKKNKKIK